MPRLDSKSPEFLASRREKYKLNREHFRAINKRSYEKNRAKNRAATRRWQEENKDRRREYMKGYTRRRRGQMEAPTRPCPERCENPGCRELMHTRALAEDHDHRTGKFRGWLCGSCNTAIGKLGDSLEGLLLSTKYFTEVVK